jgi:hypothetical protein
MIQVTPEAANHLLRLRTERGFEPNSAARFIRNSGRVGLTFAPAPEPGDRVVEGVEGIPVCVAPDVVEALDHSIVDARAEDGKMVLVIRRKREKAAASPARRDS